MDWCILSIRVLMTPFSGRDKKKDFFFFFLKMLKLHSS